MFKMLGSIFKLQKKLVDRQIYLGSLNAIFSSAEYIEDSVTRLEAETIARSIRGPVSDKASD